MAEDLIRYDILVQDALRGIVRKVLHEVARAGLPGDHHFYISFETGARGVQVSNRIRAKYPKEMTIVLQHQFWDLVVTETSFDVGLSFGGVPEHLHIPFSAVKGFFDPHVQFNLQFEPYRAEDGETEPEANTDRRSALLTAIDENAAAAERTDEAIASLTAAANTEDMDADASWRDDDAEVATAAKPEDGEEGEGKAGAEVVSLDAFRKKP